MRHRKCEDCEFWVQLKADVAAQKGRGQCRRMPPQNVHTPNAEVDEFISRWPAVHRSHWCGEFSPRDPVNVREAVQFARAGVYDE